MRARSCKQDALKRIDSAIAHTRSCLAEEVALAIAHSKEQSAAGLEVQFVRAIEETLLLMIAHRAAIAASRKK